MLFRSGPKVNHGSKGVLIGCGEARRELPREVPQALPGGTRRAGVFCPGCLVLEAPAFSRERDYPRMIAQDAALRGWPLVVLVDNLDEALKDASSFLWTTFTRFEPAATGRPAYDPATLPQLHLYGHLNRVPSTPRASSRRGP